MAALPIDAIDRKYEGLERKQPTATRSPSPTPTQEAPQSRHHLPGSSAARSGRFCFSPITNPKCLGFNNDQTRKDLA